MSYTLGEQLLIALYLPLFKADGVDSVFIYVPKEDEKNLYDFSSHRIRS
jgi:hypothetical protein